MNTRRQKVTPVGTIDIAYQKIIELGIATCKCVIHRPTEDKSTECGCGKELLKDDGKSNEIGKKGNKRGEPVMNQNEQYDQFWDRDKCTVPDKTVSAFGEIKFIGATENIAQYVRVDFRTEMKTMMTLLNEIWNINQPRLIISVTGGAKLTLKTRLRETFSKGLVKVATTTNALITTGGSYSGCMKLVGEAFKDNALSMDVSHKISILGIANWGTVTSNYKLINNKNNMQKEYELVKPKSKVKTELLDPNHTHFILVDDTTNKWGGEVKFRTSLEAKISSHFDNIPIVVLVVGGGPRTVQTVLGSIDKHSPCVFLESSGESADIFVFALKKMEEIRKKENKNNKKNDKPKDDPEEFKVDDEFYKEIYAKFQNEYSNKTEKEIKEMVETMEKCLNPKFKNLLTVCPSNNLNAQIDVAILNALLRAVKKGDDPSKQALSARELSKRSTQKKSPKIIVEQDYSKYQKQLHLALDWNRADIARKFIFTDELSDQIGPLNDLMFRAIKENRIEFVNLFLEKGFSIKNFLTYRVLLKFYNSIPDNSTLYRILNNYKKGQSKFHLSDPNSPIADKNENENVYTFKNIGYAIQFLVKDLFQHKFTKAPFSIIDNSYCIKILNDTDEYGKMMPQTIGIFNDIENKSERIDIDHKFASPETELFIYSVLLGRSDMAKLFCTIGNDSVCSALVAKTIFKSYSKLFEETSIFYSNLSDEYEEFAHSLLNAYYNKDEEAAKFALLRKITEYDNITCMQIAVGSNCLSIMAHQCFQNVLNKIWLNKMQPDFTFYKFTLAVLFPPIAPLILRFQKDKVKFDQTDEESSLEFAGDDFDNEFEFVLKRSQSEILENDFKLKEAFYFKKLFYFITTPYVKFIYFQVFYLMFLLLFSYVILCDFYPIGYNNYSTTSPGISISALEVLLIIWVGTFLMDEIRAFNINEIKVFKAKFKNLVTNMWNLSDYTAIFLFIVGTILRFIPTYRCYLAARILLSIDIMVWFFKSLNAYTLNRNLGPKLLMIKKMLPQLGYFLLIVVLFMFAFGVSTHSLMYHNSALNSKLLSDVFFPAFWVIGGEYYTRDLIMNPNPPNCNQIDNENSTYVYSYGPDDCPNGVGSDVSLAIYVFYLILLDILLVNLLIAIFNNTYQNIETQANKISKSQRYSIVFDFYYKPILPPPFVIISYVGSVIGLIISEFRRLFVIESKSRKSYLGRFIRFISKRQTTGFVYEFCDAEKNRIVKWESYNTDEYVYTKEKEIEKTTEYKLDQNVQKLDTLCFKFDELIDSQNKDDLSKRVETLSNNLKNLLELMNNDYRK